MDDESVAGEARSDAAVEIYKLRTTRSTQELLERIDLAVRVGISGTDHPIRQIFIRGGEPVVPVLLNFIENSTSDKKIEAAVYALTQIKGARAYNDFLGEHRNDFSQKLFQRLVRYAVW